MPTLLIYGMGEKQIVEIADYLAGRATIEDIHYVRGTAYLADDLQALDEFIELPSLEDILKDREAFAKAYNLQSKEQDPFLGRLLSKRTAKNLLFKIKYHFLCHRKKWMLFMIWIICVLIILLMKNTEECLQ